MKRFLAALLAGLLLLSLAACSGKEESVVQMGVLDAGAFEGFDNTAHAEHRKADSSNSVGAKKAINYTTLSSALLDLESGKIDVIDVSKSTAEYMAVRNDKITVTENYTKSIYSMMTLDTNHEVYAILNNAINEMKADGTLDALIENELKAYIASDPEVEDLPHFEGAKTIKVGVTGDMPPMDFVAANGGAAGFNIALLTEIANRTRVNFELVQIETGSRPIALSSGKVDAVFWTKGISCDVCGTEGVEKIDGTLVTESYFSDGAAFIHHKSEK